MYVTGTALPSEGLPSGTVLLCAGPQMVGKRELVMRLLAQGIENGEATALLSTDRTASELYEELAGLTTVGLTASPLGVVEATGTPGSEPPSAGHVETVGSPTDLTGIGIGLSNLLERFRNIDEQGEVRVGLLSLSTMVLYSDPERVLRFLHVFGRRVRETDAIAFVVLDESAVDEETAGQITSFVDGAIDVRERDGTRAVRIRGLPEVDTEWIDCPREPQSAAPTRTAEPATTERPTVDSLAALCASVEADRPTLTVANFTGPAESLSAIEEYFKRVKVGVRTTELGLDSPSDVALLHRGSDLLAAASVPAVDAGIQIESEERHGQRTELLEAVDQTVFDASGADRQFLVQVSHTIETLAIRAGDGEIHAGFQELSRLWEDDRAREIYRRIAEADVDVHVYGVADVEVPEPDWTVHTVADGELTDTWFVGFTPSAGDRTGVLVAEEHEDGYYGFWSYRAERAEQLRQYLESAYPSE